MKVEWKRRGRKNEICSENAKLYRLTATQAESREI